MSDRAHWRFGCRGFDEMQTGAFVIVDHEFRAHTHRQSDIPVWHVARRHSHRDRNPQITKTSAYNLIEGVALPTGLNTVGHLAEDNPRHLLELPGNLQLPEHAV